MSGCSTLPRPAPRARTGGKPLGAAFGAWGIHGGRWRQGFLGLLVLLHHKVCFEHEKAKTELKGLVPEDAKEAIGHGVRAKRSKSGAIRFDLLEVEDSDAALQ